MARKSRGRRDRLANPAQIAQLRDLHLMKHPEPITYAMYRRLMRQYRHPDSNPETERAAWAHFQTAHVDKPFAAFLQAFRAVRDAERARAL